ncbi:MAG TPA: hypothetical protein PL048_07955, partial [Leptospiraceae bacterium]|nr:hypothetical protein [Leptospiraceae bacterium]
SSIFILEDFFCRTGKNFGFMNEIDYIAKIQKTKQEIKKELTALPFEEKIRRLIEMQKISKELKKDRNIEVFVWEIM